MANLRKSNKIKKLKQSQKKYSVNNPALAGKILNKIKSLEGIK